MYDTTTTPWGTLFSLLLASAGVLCAVIATVKIAEWIASLRDELRGRYGDKRWKPAYIDMLVMPLWLSLELLCLIGSIVFTLMTIWVAYETAKTIRNWWHAGARNRW
jgi:hypothetical protein